MPPSKSSRRLTVFLLRFLISKGEYERLECILSPYTPNSIRPHLPSTADFDERPRSPNREMAIVEAAIGARDDLLPGTARQGIRVFAGTYTLATLVDVVLIGIIKRHGKKNIIANLRNKQSFQTALATSLTVSLYRTLLRVLSLKKLRTILPPAFLAGVVSGLALILHPGDSRRVTVTIYFLTRTLEFCYNLLDDKGYLPREKPWWFGSWLIFPLSSAQLLHSFVFDRDCFPQGYGEFILKYSSPYITSRPSSLPSYAPWPHHYEIVDSLVTISHLNYPKFYSPTLFKGAGLPASLNTVAPLINSAHPGISKLTCAVLHSGETSCLKVLTQFVGQQWGRIGKFIAAVYALIGLATYRSIKRQYSPIPIPQAYSPLISLPFMSSSSSSRDVSNGSPAKQLPLLIERLLRTTTFITGAIGTSWASICLFQHILPSNFLPQKRFFLGGLLGGMWAFVDRKKGRGRFLYSARLSIESGWKVAVKRGLVKPVKGGDVLLFALSMGILMSVFEKAPSSIAGGTVRKSLSWISGRGFVDPVPRADEIRSLAKTSTTSSFTSEIGNSDASNSAEGSQGSESMEGSAVLGSLGQSSISGEDVGEGVRVLDEGLVNSPVGLES